MQNPHLYSRFSLLSSFSHWVTISEMGVSPVMQNWEFENRFHRSFMFHFTRWEAKWHRSATHHTCTSSIRENPDPRPFQETRLKTPQITLFRTLKTKKSPISSSKLPSDQFSSLCKNFPSIFPHTKHFSSLSRDKSSMCAERPNRAKRLLFPRTSTLNHCLHLTDWLWRRRAESGQAKIDWDLLRGWVRCVAMGPGMLLDFTERDMLPLSQGEFSLSRETTRCDGGDNNFR